MRVRTRRAKIEVNHLGGVFLFDFPTPSELEEINDKHTGINGKTDGRAVMEDLWTGHLSGWSGVEAEEGTPLGYSPQSAKDVWDADTVLCCEIVNKALEKLKAREDLAEKN